MSILLLASRSQSRTKPRLTNSTCPARAISNSKSNSPSSSHERPLGVNHPQSAERNRQLSVREGKHLKGTDNKLLFREL
jgi:hypothetical protein